MKAWLTKLFLCWSPLPMHDWTCAAQEGVPPTQKQLEDGVEGFFDYARTYCRRCGTESTISSEARAKAAKEADHG